MQKLTSKDWVRMLISFLLEETETDLQKSVERLSSGLRIESAKDDPSGLADGCNNICERDDVCPADCA